MEDLSGSAPVEAYALTAREVSSDTIEHISLDAHRSCVDS